MACVASPICGRLWSSNTPSVHGFGDWLTNAGRFTGLLAGYGVIVLVALMARIYPSGIPLGDLTCFALPPAWGDATQA